MDDRLAKHMLEDNILVRLKKAESDIALLQKLGISLADPNIYTRILFKDSTLPTITAAAPGTVTVFDVPVPEDFLVGDNGLRYMLHMYLDTNANARTINAVLYYDDTVIATSGALNWGANINRDFFIGGEVLATGENTQRGTLRWDYVTTATFAINSSVYTGTGAEDVSSSKNLKLTLAFSGSVDSAVLYSALIEMLEAPL